MARDRLARHLGVTAPAHGGIWLLRAIFQPPRPGKPDVPAEWAALLYRRALARLGMGRRRDPAAWLWRLFIRPPRPRYRLAADLRKRHQVAAPRRDAGCDAVPALAGPPARADLPRGDAHAAPPCRAAAPRELGARGRSRGSRRHPRGPHPVRGARVAGAGLPGRCGHQHHAADVFKPAAAVRHRLDRADGAAAHSRPAADAGDDGALHADGGPLYLVALHADAAVHHGHRGRRGLHPLRGRGLHLDRAGAGLPANGVAAEPPAQGAAGRPGDLAHGGRLHPHLQRVAGGAATHRVRGAEHGLAGTQAARVHSRRWPPAGDAGLRGGGRGGLPHARGQFPRQGAATSTRHWRRRTASTSRSSTATTSPRVPSCR